MADRTVEGAPLPRVGAQKIGRAGLLWVALLASVAVPARAADPAAGQAVFRSQCSACHSVMAGRNLVGPSLFGIVGRHSGSAPGFAYSPANKAADVTWSEAGLDEYLAAPKDMIPGTTMSYPGLFDDAKRADLVAYLATLHGE